MACISLSAYLAYLAYGISYVSSINNLDIYRSLIVLLGLLCLMLNYVWNRFSTPSVTIDIL